MPISLLRFPWRNVARSDSPNVGGIFLYGAICGELAGSGDIHDGFPVPVVVAPVEVQARSQDPASDIQKTIAILSIRKALDLLIPSENGNLKDRVM